MTSVDRGGAGVAAVLATAAALAFLVPATPAAAANDAPPTLETTAAIGPAGSGPGGAADLSSDGRTAALVDEAGRLYLREMTTHKMTVVDTGGARASSPSVSRDGRRIAYVATSGGRTETRVLDRGGAGGSSDQPLSGGTHDLAFQRAAGCSPCSPQLSDDGRTVVSPARQAVTGAAVVPYLLDSSGLRQDLDGSPTAPMLMDFGAGVTPARPVERVIHVGSVGGQVVTMSQPTLRTDGSYEIVRDRTTCGSGTVELAGDDSCAIAVRLTPRTSDCSGSTSFGTLTINSPAAAGQTVVALVGDGSFSCHSRAALVRNPPSGSTCGAQPATGTRKPARVAVRLGTGGEAPTSLGDVAVGDEALFAVLVTNEPSGLGDDLVAGPRRVRFASSDCDVAMVVPDQLDPALPPPCHDGSALPPAVALNTPLVGVAVSLGTCTAYLRVRPTAVGAYAASLDLEPAGPGTSTSTLRLGATASSDVLVARRDPTGSGDWSLPARNVAVDGHGSPIRAGAASVSADGRWVAFAGAPPAGAVAGTGRQIWLHDTDAAGNATYQPGSTELASALPGGGPTRLPLWADSPSLSADGRTVAFEARPDDGGAPCGCSQVFVSDLGRKTTLLASATSGGTPAAGDSFSPALSADGSTVAFASRGELGETAGGPSTRTRQWHLLRARLWLLTHGRTTGAPATVDRSDPGALVYVRDLGPDRGTGGERGAALVSAGQPGKAPPTRAGRPAIDEDGRTILFRADGDLGDAGHGRENLPGVDARPTDDLTWSHERQGFLTPDQATVDLGKQPLDVIPDPSTLTIGNSGPGPARPDVVVDGPVSIADSCSGRTLHRGESCTVEVTPAPSDPGELTGNVQISDDRDPTAGAPATSSGEGDVTLTGETTEPVLDVTPDAVFTRPLGIGATGTPDPVLVRNGSGDAVQLRLTAAPAEDFTLGPGNCGGMLAPRQTCTASVVFHPRTENVHAGTLNVIGVVPGRGLTAQHVVPLVGVTDAPVIAVDAPVVRVGDVVTVTGLRFPRNAVVEVTGLGDLRPVKRVPTDATGGFRLPVIVLSGDRPGRWQVSAFAPSIVPVTGPDVVVEPASVQPSGFVGRR